MLRIDNRSLELALLMTLASGSLALAQPAPPTPTPAPAPTPTPTPAPMPGDPAAPPTDGAPAPATDVGKLRIHIFGTRGAYIAMKYDVFSVETRQVITSGVGAIESRGEVPSELELPPGVYKIVRAGEPFETRVDFAVATVVAGETTDFLITVDPDTNAFRASGPVIGELPRGREIIGIRLSLNGGGNFLFNQKRNAVGVTSGDTAQFGLFGNFGLVFDRGTHFLDVSSSLALDLVDPVTGGWTPNHDRFEAAALYSYKLNNPYFGPYVRASMTTHITPGYLYLDSEAAQGTVVINKLDGTTEMRTYGARAKPDDLRVKISEPFGPVKLQEELGGNLKAVDMDLLLFKLVVSTRVGFGFRQVLTNGLLVVRGSEDAEPVVLDEIDDYTTLGPVVGANASVTFARWLFGSAQIGVLAPLTNRDRAGDSFGGRLLFDFSGAAGFKVPILTNLLFASADYTFRLERDGFITSETQFEHSLMARASLTLF